MQATNIDVPCVSIYINMFSRWKPFLFIKNVRDDFISIIIGDTIPQHDPVIIGVHAI